jgi:hypothetical protein
MNSSHRRILYSHDIKGLSGQSTNQRSLIASSVNVSIAHAGPHTYIYYLCVCLRTHPRTRTDGLVWRVNTRVCVNVSARTCAFFVRFNQSKITRPLKCFFVLLLGTGDGAVNWKGGKMTDRSLISSWFHHSHSRREREGERISINEGAHKEQNFRLT